MVKLTQRFFPIHDRYGGLGVLFCGLIGSVVLAGCQMVELGPTADYVAVRPQAAYAGRLADCAAAPSSTLCSFERLPLLGQQTATPTIDDLMGRVVVSHQWMGQRFEEALRAMPAGLLSDILQLSRAITVISIGADIRPSFYSSSRAAIYLDAARLWTTVAEKQTISTAPDYRSGFGDGLPYRILWRLVKDNEYAYSVFSLTDDSERTIEDTVVRLARLLAHELAHANDYFAPQIISYIEQRYNPSQAISRYSEVTLTIELNDIIRQETYTTRTSTVLSSESPLESEQLYDFARARYGGDRDKYEVVSAYSAEQMGAWLEPDRANHTYSYTTSREDVAMLFEATLMKLHFDIDYDIGFVIDPLQEDAQREDYIVGWGVRGRLGEPSVRERAQFVAERLLPRADPLYWERFFEQLQPSPAMDTSCDWWDNLDLVCDPQPEASRSSEAESLDPDERRRRARELQLRLADERRSPHE